MQMLAPSPCEYTRTSPTRARTRGLPSANQSRHFALFEILSSPVFHRSQKIALFVTVYLSEREYFIIHKILLLDVGYSHFLIVAAQKLTLRDGTIVDRMFDPVSFHNWILKASGSSPTFQFCQLVLSCLPFRVPRDTALPLHLTHAKASPLRRW